jgi:hypothetical protein
MSAKISSSIKMTVQPDERGRITLGKLAEGVSSYQVFEEEDGRLVLVPFAEIPAKEAWLFRNKRALASVKAGLTQSGSGELKSLGDFSQFADADDE